MIPVDNIGGSNRLRATRDGSFQEISRRSHNAADSFHLAMAAAAVNESLVTISYDWRIRPILNRRAGRSATHLVYGTIWACREFIYAIGLTLSGHTGRDRASLN